MREATFVSLHPMWTTIFSKRASPQASNQYSQDWPLSARIIYCRSIIIHLLRHRNKECGVEPSFACTYCDYRTAHNSTLKTHITNVHGWFGNSLLTRLMFPFSMLLTLDLTPKRILIKHCIMVKTIQNKDNMRVSSKILLIRNLNCYNLLSGI